MSELVERLRLIAAWKLPGGPTPKSKMPSVHKAAASAADHIERLEAELAAEKALHAITIDVSVRFMRERDALRETLAKIVTGDYPRTVAHYWRADQKPSKHDQCEHGLSMWQVCENCLDAFVEQTLSPKDTGQ